MHYKEKIMKYFLISVCICGYSILGHAQEFLKGIDGNIYNTVTVGTQEWMAENLKVNHYNDGTPIPFVLNNEKWSLLVKGAYCVSKKNPIDYKDTYGVLYNYYTVNDKRGLCPEGWHVPTALEWQALIDYLGGSYIAGGKMKNISSNLWKRLVNGANNSSGFSGIPAGGRGRFGSVEEIGYYATWWSSTSCDSIYAWHWGLYPDKNDIRYNPGHKASGFSVRCIKDK